jgi:hypothetical protein
VRGRKKPVTTQGKSPPKKSGGDGEGKSPCVGEVSKSTPPKKNLGIKQGCKTLGKSKFDILAEQCDEEAEGKSPGKRPREIKVVAVTPGKPMKFMPPGDQARMGIADNIGIKLFLRRDYKVSQFAYNGRNSTLQDRHSPFIRDKVPGDGNCLFHCISWLIYKDLSFSGKIRAKVCMYISSGCGWPILSAFVSEGSPESGKNYVQETGMERTNRYATQLEIQALAMLFSIDICVFNVPSQRELLGNPLVTAHWLRYNCSGDPNVRTVAALHLYLKCEHFSPVTDLLPDAEGGM